MEALIFALILVAVAAGVIYSFVQKQRRREALAIFALQNKVEYSRADPFELIDHDFHLFRLGDGRGCENVVWGGWHGLSVKAANDAPMMRWLLSTRGSFGFEVNGPTLLVWCGRLRPTGLVPLFGSAALFRDHIPRLVWNEYGTGSPASPEGERSTS